MTKYIKIVELNFETNIIIPKNKQINKQTKKNCNKYFLTAHASMMAKKFFWNFMFYFMYDFLKKKNK